MALDSIPEKPELHNKYFFHLDHPLNAVQAAHLRGGVQGRHAVPGPGREVAPRPGHQVLQHAQVTLLGGNIFVLNANIFLAV